MLLLEQLQHVQMHKFHGSSVTVLTKWSHIYNTTGISDFFTSIFVTKYSVIPNTGVGALMIMVRIVIMIGIIAIMMMIIMFNW